MNFTVLELPAKVFSSKFGSDILTLHVCQVLAFRESFLREMVILTNPQKFSPSTVSHYTVFQAIL